MSDFHFSIDSSILADQKLSPNAKMLYCSIVAMSKDGYCYATNKHLAKTMKLAVRTVARRLNELIDNGYLRREIEYRNTHKLYPLIMLKGMTQMSHPYDTNVTPPMTQMSYPYDTNVIPYIKKNKERRRRKYISAGAREENFGTERSDAFAELNFITPCPDTDD